MVRRRSSSSSPATPAARRARFAKVASGGELSRLALAIAVTTAQSASGTPAPSEAASPPSPSSLPADNAASMIGTLIFDEIDSGVGGTVADSVGRLMKRLGRHVQVLAVTHLPQVAACGDHHFVVAKRSVGGHTTSQVTPLNGESRVAEVPGCWAANAAPAPASRTRRS